MPRPLFSPSVRRSETLNVGGVALGDLLKAAGNLASTLLVPLAHF